MLNNKNGTEFNVTEEQFLEISAATVLLEESFDQFDGTPDEFLAKADMLLPNPTFLGRTTDTTLLGNSVFIGIGKYGRDFVKKMLVNDPERTELMVTSLFHYTLSLLDVLNNMEDADRTVDQKGEE